MLQNHSGITLFTICVCECLMNKYTKCDVMGQNQSHVAKHETAQICILSENVKICQFFCFHQKRNICVTFCQLNMIFSHFCYIFHTFFGFLGITFIDDETQFFLFKAIFLKILIF